MEWAQGVYPFLSVVRGRFPPWGEVLDRLGYQWCFPVFVVSPVGVCPIGFEVSFVFCVFLPFEPAPVFTHCQVRMSGVTRSPITLTAGGSVK